MYFVFHRRKTVIQVWSNMRVSNDEKHFEWTTSLKLAVKKKLIPKCKCWRCNLGKYFSLVLLTVCTIKVPAKSMAPRGSTTVLKLFVIQIWGEIRKKNEGRCLLSHMSQNNAKEWREIPDSPPRHPLTTGLIIHCCIPCCSEWKG